MKKQNNWTRYQMFTRQERSQMFQDKMFRTMFQPRKTWEEIQAEMAKSNKKEDK
jgi:hypothetical protein